LPLCAAQKATLHPAETPDLTTGITRSRELPPARPEPAVCAILKRRWSMISAETGAIE